MDIAYCAACPHPRAAHVVGGQGRCRFNSCPCQAFVRPEPAAFPIVLAPTPGASKWPGWLSTFGRPAIAFIAGVMLGLNL